MRIFERNWMQIEEYLQHDDRIVLPVGSTEQHGYLSLGTDAILAERVAVEAAEPLGIPVLPALAFGMAPYFTSFPGSISLRMSTYIEIYRDILDVLSKQGFRRIAIINGHGGNAAVSGLIREWICNDDHPRTEVLFHSWYNAPETAAVASQFEVEQLHGGWVENFPWTRVEGVEIPSGKSPVLDRSVVNGLNADEIRRRTNDGVMGGSYARSDESMMEVWRAGVREVRTLLESGWAL